MNSSKIINEVRQEVIVQHKNIVKQKRNILGKGYYVLWSLMIFTMCLIVNSTVYAEEVNSEVTSESEVTTQLTDQYTVKNYIGSGSFGFFNGDFSESTFTILSDLAIDLDGNMLIADSLVNKIRMTTEDEVIDLFGNLNGTDFSGLPLGGYKDGTLSEVLLKSPSKLLALKNGNILFTENETNTIRLFHKTEKKIFTFTGSITAGYQNGPVENALFNHPMGMAQDSKGNIYVADTLNHVIRIIDTDGNVSLFAGTPKKYGDKEGYWRFAQFNEPTNIFITENDEIYVVDSGNNKIKQIDGKKVVTVAGATTALSKETETQIGGDKDGDVNSAEFSYPMDIYVKEDVIYVADTLNHKIKMIKDGLVTTIAGTGEIGNDLGEGSLATFNCPNSILVVKDNIYVSDSENNVIKVLNSNTTDVE